jgi:hypothetical protein
MMCKQRESVALASIVVFVALLAGGCQSDSSESSAPGFVEPGSIAPGFGQWKYVPTGGSTILQRRRL